MLVVVTALVVARPVVPGEDPGLLSDSEPSGTVLTLLWLVAALAWAAWRLWARRGQLFLGVADACLWLTVVLVALSAGLCATYARPARLIAWEWVALALTFLLVRQFASDPEDRHGLLAVVLAGGVSLSAQAVYQIASLGPSALPAYQAHATFLRPESLAAYLALLLPPLVGAVVACRQARSAPSRLLLAGAFALLGACALWLTRQGAAALACLAAGALTALAAWRYQPARTGRGLAAVVLALGAGCAVVFGAGSFRWGDPASLRQGWRTTLELIARHPWGVGPGNFANAYPRFLDDPAAARLAHPSNFVLEIASTAGVLAALALLAVFVVLFSRVVRWWGGWVVEGATPEDQPAPTTRPAPSGSTTPPPHHPTTPPPEQPSVRWEYYLGGTFGLLLSFVLRVFGDVPADTLRDEAIAAIVRCLAWFAAFALYERLDWSEKTRTLALSAGVLALLLYLCVAPGIDFPSVAGPLWVSAALVMAAVAPGPAGWLSRQRLALMLPVPALIAAGLGYFTFVFYPVTATASAANRALRNAAFFSEQMRQPVDRRDQRFRTKGQVIAFLRVYVLAPLQQAAREDPDDDHVRIQLAAWCGQLWVLEPRDDNAGKASVAWAVLAQKINPDGPAGYEAEYDIRLRMATALNTWADNLLAWYHWPFFTRQTDKQREDDRRTAALYRKKAQNQQDLAARALRRYASRDPSDLGLRYRIAEAFAEAGKPEEARAAAEVVERLDRRGPPGLTDPQRKNVRRWLGRSPGR